MNNDIEQIAAWFEAQAASEREALDSGQCRPDAKERTLERWIVYKASAQAVRNGDWKQYVFTKSGSIVTIVGKPPEDQELVTVRRVDSGKEMVVPRSALVLRTEVV